MTSVAAPPGTHTFDPSLRLGRPWPMGDGHVYIVATRNAGSSLPSGAVIRYDGTKAVVLPVPSAVSIGGWGNDVVVLGEDAIYRYRHDPADVFAPWPSPAAGAGAPPRGYGAASRATKASRTPTGVCPGKAPAE